jgi:hypothetical protein
MTGATGGAALPNWWRTVFANYTINIQYISYGQYITITAQWLWCLVVMRQ